MHNKTSAFVYVYGRNSFRLFLNWGRNGCELYLTQKISPLYKFKRNMSESLEEGDGNCKQFSNHDDSCINDQIKELNYNYKESLDNKPEILKYIERLHTIIRRQQKKLNKFYNKLKDHRFVKCHGRTSIAIQTDDETEKMGNHSEPDISASPKQNTQPWEEGSSIVEEVKEAAEDAMKQTSFVYEPTSGMYYDYSTGYYYNAELRMYYDGNSGRYLIYNEETKKYHFENGEEVPCTNETSQKRKRKYSEKHKAKKAKDSKLEEAEEGEITESSVSSCETEGSSDGEEDSKNEEMSAFYSGEAGLGCEPCIRIIVEETTVEKLKPGSLFMVTCKGGTMGREGDHAVLIPDINVSKHHAKFSFNALNSIYTITDLGSRNGTWLDGERLSAALQESEAFELKHGAIIQVGGSKLLCHVHLGRNTCASCEPGLVQTVSDKKEPLKDNPVINPEYKEQLHKLKKKYGVHNPSPDVFNLPGYEDRAEIRRNTVGSSHHSEKTQIASVNEGMPQTNKGYQMLVKMGWNAGEALGKDDRGLLEPVNVTANEGKTGLGATTVPEPLPSASAKKKQAILQKTQDRFYRISKEESDS